jgi:hypothetical protein
MAKVLAEARKVVSELVQRNLLFQLVATISAAISENQPNATINTFRALAGC